MDALRTMGDKMRSAAPGKVADVGAAVAGRLGAAGLRVASSDSEIFGTTVDQIDSIRDKLEGNSARDKLDAMKRLIAMVSHGADVVAVFPSVVKNVVSTHMEVKRLVYMYLIHYAELEPDTILLSIATFQKDMKAKDPLIRASALRVMSSIRVKMISQLVMIAIKQAIIDSSPYVRKTAAHAVQKLYSVDPSLADDLVEVIGSLLADASTMVLGSAVAAFEEVCPDRLDLLHGVYRKMCHLLADMDEWGQVLVLRLLLRYGRTQFADPSPEAVERRLANRRRSRRQRREIRRRQQAAEAAALAAREAAAAATAAEGGDEQAAQEARQRADQAAQDAERAAELAAKAAAAVDQALDGDLGENGEGGGHAGEQGKDVSAADDDDDDDDDDDEEGDNNAFDDDLAAGDLDADHRLLLRSAQPLLQSMSSAVVMQVAVLFTYLAPANEANVVGKALCRVLRSSREQAYVALCNIATLCVRRPAMFRPHLAEFFIADDPPFSASVKLEILTHLAHEGNIGRVLRELNAYAKREDQQFVRAAVRAIGRCAAQVPDVMESCMASLMRLLADRSPEVAAEAVVVMKRLLQLGAGEGRDNETAAVVRQLARLLDDTEAPTARAAIAWVVGEYVTLVRPFAPDVLRRFARSFAKEADDVKMQIINLAAKLVLAVRAEIADPAAHPASPTDKYNRPFTGPAKAHVESLAGYVLAQAKYDLCYDVRDRARLIRGLLFSGEQQPEQQEQKKDGSSDDGGDTTENDGPQSSGGDSSSKLPLVEQARRLFVTTKPKPTTRSEFEDRWRYTLGTMSHLLNHTVAGYEPLPEFPVEVPDRSVRDNEVTIMHGASMSSADGPTGFGGGGSSSSGGHGVGSSSFSSAGHTVPGSAGSSSRPGAADPFDEEAFWNDDGAADEGGYGYGEGEEYDEEFDEEGYYDEDGEWYPYDGDEEFEEGEGEEGFDYFYGEGEAAAEEGKAAGAEAATTTTAPEEDWDSFYGEENTDFSEI